MTTSWFGVSVSALALACAAHSARAGELDRPVADRFSTEALFAPSAGPRTPMIPDLHLDLKGGPEVSPIRIDPFVTGQIAKPSEDGAAAARADAEPESSAPAGTAPEPEAPAASAEVEPQPQPTAEAGPTFVEGSPEPDPLPASAHEEPDVAAAPAGEPAPAAGTDRHDAAPAAASAEATPAEGALTGATHAEGAPEGDAHAEAAPAGEAHGAGAPAEGDAHAAPAFAETRGPAPFDIIRTIQFLQDQVARGNGRAIRVQAALLRRFGPVFLAADGKVWKDGRNRRAAVLFVLSGGPPEVLRRLLQSGQLENDPEALFQGALAYVQNNVEKAAKLLSTVDLVGMEPGLAAHIHLVLGQMQQTKDPEGSIRHLDQARLLAPGGLIEEAALRMEVLIAEDKGKHDIADRLARQYFDRYARSSYSANFEARFAAVYAGRTVEDPKTSVDTILDVTARLSPDSRRSLLLAVARRALVDGKLGLAELASDAAGAIEGIADPERQRAELYATAARLGKGATSDASALLDAIRRDELHPDDAKLLDAAHSVIASIERPLGTPSPPAEGDETADSLPVFARAEKLLNDVSDDLGKVQK